MPASLSMPSPARLAASGSAGLHTNIIHGLRGRSSSNYFDDFKVYR